MFKKTLLKFGPMFCAVALFLGQQMSLYYCPGPYYQPKEPQNLLKVKRGE